MSVDVWPPIAFWIAFEPKSKVSFFSWLKSPMGGAWFLGTTHPLSLGYLNRFWRPTLFLLDHPPSSLPIKQATFLAWRWPFYQRTNYLLYANLHTMRQIQIQIVVPASPHNRLFPRRTPTNLRRLSWPDVHGWWFLLERNGQNLPMGRHPFHPRTLHQNRCIWPRARGFPIH